MRTAFARSLTGIDKIYVGKMGSYPEVCEQLFGATVASGLSPKTLVLGIADGGNGLKEELETNFPVFQFILDKYHFSHHLYETAEALGYSEEKRKTWIDNKLIFFSSGKNTEGFDSLKNEYDECKNERLRIFIRYRERFKNCLHYNAYKEKGYPIGSGEIESAHRYIPQERLKLPGTWWHSDNVNSMLALRLIQANGW